MPSPYILCAMSIDLHGTGGQGGAGGGEAPRREGIVVLTERELRQVVALDHDALAAIEEAFSRLAAGQAEVPPILGLFVPERRGEVDVKGAVIQGLPSLAIKIASGFFDNQSWGLPSGSGLMVVLSARTGYPQAILLDNGYLTDVRTALAGAAAARHLAPRALRTVGIVGAGAQGRYQAQALQLVRSFDRVLVYDRSEAAVEAYVREMPGVLGRHRAAGGAGGGAPVEVEAADPETLVRRSDLVVTCTPSHEPIVRAEWLHAGLHVTAMGADTPEKHELESAVLGRASRLACDLKRQCFERGEFRHARADGAIGDATPIAELGELTSGRQPGRRDDSEITVCALTGVGVQDTAIALLAYGRAAAAGLGAKFDG